MEAALYIVPTPIGNLSDISQRAIDVLRQATLIAAEDTRHSQVLLSHLGISTPMVAHHEHSTAGALSKLLDRLRQGESVALISDAGTPLVSDPGYRLVREVQDAGLPVVPIPGPCSLITALCASGLPTNRFYFEGFLPAKSVQRRRRLEALAELEVTLIVLEAPHRVAETLQDMLAIFGSEREVTLARELTKSFETIRRLPLEKMWSWVTDDVNQQRGELVLLLGPPAKQSATTVTEGALRILRLLSEELPPRKASALTAEITGARARDLYNLLMLEKRE
ncbi:MAG: 16S rRNA (cytidine(1402)-2'-O)-methyltransferase [Halieaceae bacterium]